MKNLENLINILDKADAQKITKQEADKLFDANLTETITLFSNHDRALVECVLLNDFDENDKMISYTIIKIYEVEDDDIYAFEDIDRNSNGNAKEIAFYKVDTERQYKDFLIAFIENSYFNESVVG